MCACCLDGSACSFTDQYPGDADCVICMYDVCCSASLTNACKRMTKIQVINVDYRWCVALKDGSLKSHVLQSEHSVSSFFGLKPAKRHVQGFSFFSALVLCRNAKAFGLHGCSAVHFSSVAWHH